MKLRNSNDIHRVVSSYSTMVYRLAFARTNNHSDAEDICQEVFLTLVHKNPDFETEEKRKAWLIRVTVNRAKNTWGRFSVLKVYGMVFLDSLLH